MIRPVELRPIGAQHQRTPFLRPHSPFRTESFRRALGGDDHIGRRVIPIVGSFSRAQRHWPVRQCMANGSTYRPKCAARGEDAPYAPCCSPRCSTHGGSPETSANHRHSPNRRHTSLEQGCNGGLGRTWRERRPSRPWRKRRSSARRHGRALHAPRAASSQPTREMPMSQSQNAAAWAIEGTGRVPAPFQTAASRISAVSGRACSSPDSPIEHKYCVYDV